MTDKRIYRYILRAMLSCLGLFLFWPGAFSAYAAGETVYFGSYPQQKVTNTKLRYELMKVKEDKNGRLTWEGDSYQKRGEDYFLEEPISWKVLADDGAALTLLSEKILDNHNYGEIKWSNSGVRTWLNGEFLTRVFTKAQRADIVMTELSSDVIPYPYGGEKPFVEQTMDMVYLLDKNDLMNPNYGFSPLEGKDASRIAYVTDYVKDAYNATTKAGTYLVRGRLVVRKRTVGGSYPGRRYFAVLLYIFAGSQAGGACQERLNICNCGKNGS